jgi:hypothetical protein
MKAKVKTVKFPHFFGKNTFTEQWNTHFSKRKILQFHKYFSKQ